VTDLSDLELKLRTCCTESCARFWASELVRAKWEAGLIPIPLTHEDCERTVNETLEKLWSNNK
jgi:hypothetical protein